MRSEKELQEVQRLDNLFHKIMDEAAFGMKHYDALNAQAKMLWEYCEHEPWESERIRVMRNTETYFKTIAKIMILEAKADAYIQFG